MSCLHPALCSNNILFPGFVLVLPILTVTPQCDTQRLYGSAKCQVWAEWLGEGWLGKSWASGVWPQITWQLALQGAGFPQQQVPEGVSPLPCSGCRGEVVENAVWCSQPWWVGGAGVVWGCPPGQEGQLNLLLVSCCRWLTAGACPRWFR